MVSSLISAMNRESQWKVQGVGSRWYIEEAHLNGFSKQEVHVEGKGLEGDNRTKGLRNRENKKRNRGQS